MSPLAEADGRDAPGLIDEPDPGAAAVIDAVVVGLIGAVRQPVFAHELPYILGGIELRPSRLQRHQDDIGRHDEFGRSVPPGLFEQQDAVHARCDVEGDSSRVTRRLAVAAGYDDAGCLGFSGHIPPNIHAVERRWSFGAEARLPRLAQRRVSLVYW